jgi:hypothetical protein
MVCRSNGWSSWHLHGYGTAANGCNSASNVEGKKRAGLPNDPDAEAYNKDGARDLVLPKLVAIGGLDGAQGNIRFTNLAPLDEFADDELKQAQPDYYFGAPPEQLNQNIRTELSKHIIPSNSYLAQ